MTVEDRTRVQIVLNILSEIDRGNLTIHEQNRLAGAEVRLSLLEDDTDADMLEREAQMLSAAAD